MNPVTVYRIHMFCLKLQQSKYPFIQALGGMVTQFLMGYVYMTYLQKGEKMFKQQEAQKKGAKNGKQKVS